MQFILEVLFLASVAAAQSTSACADQPVVDLCVSSTSAIAQNCAATDYNCLCTSYNAVLTCYNNCPDDPRRDSAVSQMASYCADASIYSSSTSAVSSNPATASATTTETGSVQTTASGTMTTTSTAGVATTTKNAAGSEKVGAAGAIMGAVAVMGAML